MKLNYKTQLILTVVIVFAFNILTTLFKHWIFHSIGYCLCGLFWILHPVGPDYMERSKKNIRIIRFGGVLLILIGLFTRAYYY